MVFHKARRTATVKLDGNVVHLILLYIVSYQYIILYGKASYIVAFTKYRGIARARRLPEQTSDYQYRGIARARRQNRPIYVTHDRYMVSATIYDALL